MNKEKFRLYKDHPKTCSPDDLGGQVKRTVNGTPVSQEQIDMIIDAVVTGLELSQKDTLLDLCCCNGALITLLFKHCNSGLGVDFSKYLISVACKNFANEPHEAYILRDVVGFCEDPVTPDIFTKLLCYDSFSYIEQNRAEKFLCLLSENFQNLKRAYIGNCPDKDLLTDFFDGRQCTPGSENDPDSPIGIWRTREEFSALAKRCGWQISFQKTPRNFYAA